MNTDIKKWALEAFAARMGQGKNKNSASRLDRFLLFSANPNCLGYPCSSELSVVSFLWTAQRARYFPLLAFSIRESGFTVLFDFSKPLTMSDFS